MINLKNILTQPINNVFAEIVYNVKGTDVEMTMINGEILMENRKIKDVDENKIYEKCNDIIRRISK